MRGALAVGLALLAACGHAAPHGGSPKTKPRLVLLVVIDQWPSWIFEKQKSLFTGGIARLIKDGAIVHAAELPYANTFTAPGHATLATGAVPRVTGIIGNNWWRRDESRERPAEYDPDAMPLWVSTPLGGAEISPDDGASGKVLRVEGVADALRTGTAGAGKSVAIAFKSRSACLLAGQKPDIAVWYEPGAGGMTTSAAYATEVPAWLRELAKTAPASRYLDARWDPKDPALLARETKIPDDAAGETSNHDLGAAFPHKLAGNDKAAFAIQETPFADELVAQTVAVALDALQLGRDAAPDFLAVSFSAHDYAGHGWGQESWEVLDLTLRLDALLGELFSALDARLGAHQWAVVLTSDHGATPLIERGRIAGARRIRYDEVEGAAEKAIAGITSEPGPWVARIVSNNVYMTAKFRDLAVDVRIRALEAAAKAIAAVPGIGGARRTDLMPENCAADADIDRAVCNGVVPEIAGELFVFPVRGSLITNAKAGTSHDSPTDDNRRVPILVMAPGVAPQNGVGSLLQVAPTLAALLGIAAPSAAREKPLFGVTRR